MNSRLKNLKATGENMFTVTKARVIFMFFNLSFVKCQLNNTIVVKPTATMQIFLYSKSK